MKKLLCFFLSLTIVLLIPSTAFASEEKINIEGEVLTESTSKEVLDLAKEKICGLLKDHINGRIIDDHSYILGQPINLKNADNSSRIYDFPILRDGKIFAIFTILEENGDYSFQIEENMMARQLQSMKEEGLLEKVLFLSNRDGFFAVSGDVVIPLTPDSELHSRLESKALKSMISSKKNDESLVHINITDPIAIIPVFNNVLKPITTYPSARILPVSSVPQTDDGTFGGTIMNWCGAAVTASIINYKTGTSLTAKRITIEALGSAQNAGLTNTQVINVANRHRLYPVADNPLNFPTVKSQISSEQPIFMQMQRVTSDGSFAYHALCLIGYSTTSYTIINPWYMSSFTISKKDKGTDVKYVTGTRTYTWHKSIYNWRR